MTWFDKLKDLYYRGLIDEQRLINAVEKGLITEEQRLEILEGGQA